MKLDGRVALVTGGAKRVGRAIVMELAGAGCDLAIHYRNSRQNAEQLAEEIRQMGRRAVTIHGDLEDPATWSGVIFETVDSLGGLDVLVNNASVFLTDSPDTIDGFDAGRWESVLRTNVVACAGLCHYAQPHLESRGEGQIINLCDISSDRPWPQHLAYCTSKAALSALTRGLARSLAPKVRVNGVAPGIAVFPKEYSADLRRKLIQRVPLGRAGTPEGVARLVRFLVESGDYITGQIIPIDGGVSAV